MLRTNIKTETDCHGATAPRNDKRRAQYEIRFAYCQFKRATNGRPYDYIFINVGAIINHPFIYVSAQPTH